VERVEQEADVNSQVYPIQIGSELFRLSGASLSSDGIFYPSLPTLSTHSPHQLRIPELLHTFRNSSNASSPPVKKVPHCEPSISTATPPPSATSPVTSKATISPLVMALISSGYSQMHNSTPSPS
jgi:hypothetical protein